MEEQQQMHHEDNDEDDGHHHVFPTTTRRWLAEEEKKEECNNVTINSNATTQKLVVASNHVEIMTATTTSSKQVSPSPLEQRNQKSTGNRMNPKILSKTPKSEWNEIHRDQIKVILNGKKRPLASILKEEGDNTCLEHFDTSALSSSNSSPIMETHRVLQMLENKTPKKASAARKQQSLSLLSLWDVQRDQVQIRINGETLPLLSFGEDAIEMQKYYKAKKQKFAIGTEVQKLFLGMGWYCGTVVSFDPEYRLYKVLYEDGDAEEYHTDELALLVENAIQNKKYVDHYNKKKKTKKTTKKTNTKQNNHKVKKTTTKIDLEDSNMMTTTDTKKKKKYEEKDEEEEEEEEEELEVDPEDANSVAEKNDVVLKNDNNNQKGQVGVDVDVDDDVDDVDDDLEDDIDAAFVAKYPDGTKVFKDSDIGRIEGDVIMFDSDVGLYEVMFENGKVEEFNEAELEHMLQSNNEKKQQQQQQQQHKDTTTTTTGIIHKSNANATSTQKYKIGTKIVRDFNGIGSFSGQVIAFDPNADLYTIQYEDDDLEELDETELSDFVLPDDDNSGQNNTNKNQKYAKGTPIIKYFIGLGWFRGQVISFDPTTEVYTVEYQDGEMDEIDEAEVDSLLVRDAAIGSPGERKKNSSTQKYKYGTHVIKFFDGHGWFRGQVKEFDARTSFYTVEYEDGDQEDVEENELRKLLFNPHLYLTSSVPKVLNLHDPDDLCLWKIHGLDKPKSIRIPNHNLEKNESFQIAEFFLFISERHRMWERQKSGFRRPYSCSPIFQNHSWCNIYRELDRGTRYFRSHVLRLKELSPTITRYQWIRKVLLASYVYRQVNKVQSFTEIGIPDEYTIKPFLEEVMSYKEEGRSFFTKAHQTTNFAKFVETVKGITGNQGAYLHKITTKICEKVDSPLEVFNILRGMPLVGDFFAWQMLCDLRESRCINAKEQNFCQLGPGAKDGLGRIFYPTSDNSKHLEWTWKLVDVQLDVYRALNVEFRYWKGKLLSVKEIEHALCEFSKFKRLQQSYRTTGAAGAGMRKYKSSAHLDRHLGCYKCNKPINEGKGGTVCDTCTVSYVCHACRDESQSGTNSLKSWCCKKCEAFDQFNPIS